MLLPWWYYRDYGSLNGIWYPRTGEGSYSLCNGRGMSFVVASTKAIPNRVVVVSRVWYGTEGHFYTDRKITWIGNF